MPNMNQSIKVLEYLGEFSGDFIYGHYDDDLEDYVEVLNINKADFKDFGFPEFLTVTIRPGDELNA